MAEKKESKSLDALIARLALRVGRRIPSAEPDQLPKLNSALLILNHAQTVSGADKKVARRLLDQARRIFNSR